LRRGRVRTLWGVTPILTLPLKVRCDEALGFRSESIVYTTYYITNDFTWNLERVVRFARRHPTLHHAVCRLVLGLALLRYDIFHTFADRGLLPSDGRFGVHPEERAALRRAGKRLYVFGYGGDVRTRARTLALGAWNFCRDCDAPGKYCVCDDATGARIMRATAEAATALVSTADMLPYMPDAHHVAYWPVDTERVAFVGVTRAEGPLRVAHAPNHLHFKGTRYLEQVIAALRAEGVAIELVTRSGVSNRDVLGLFAAVDLVADQFIGGAYGYTALEAMACGKPVLTYVRDAGLVLAASECPLLNATPDTLETVLRWCVENRDRLPAIGAMGRAYVVRHHSIPATAARFARLYLETARLPVAVAEELARFVAREEQRQRSLGAPGERDHPFGPGNGATGADFPGSCPTGHVRR
jgi:glycosyltransferase involved in cell wall biosynthesis